MITASSVIHDEMDVTVEIFGKETIIRCVYTWHEYWNELVGNPIIYELNERNERIPINKDTRDEIDIEDVAAKITQEITGVNYV